MTDSEFAVTAMIWGYVVAGLLMVFFPRSISAMEHGEVDGYALAKVGCFPFLVVGILAIAAHLYFGWISSLVVSFAGLFALSILIPKLAHRAVATPAVRCAWKHLGATYGSMMKNAPVLAPKAAGPGTLQGQLLDMSVWASRSALTVTAVAMSRDSRLLIPWIDIESIATLSLDSQIAGLSGACAFIYFKPDHPVNLIVPWSTPLTYYVRDNVSGVAIRAHK